MTDISQTPPRAPQPNRLLWYLTAAVVAVAAIGFVICRTTAPFLPLAPSHVKTPWSCISFQIAPWPPGLSEIANAAWPSSGTHSPPFVVTTGTSGCSNSLRAIPYKAMSGWSS